ncbi:MAG: RNA methyltransferase [Pseudomonadota bacterium]
MFESDDARHITSRDNPLLVKLRKGLKDPAAYRKSGVLWLEGEHLCSACVAQGMAVPQALITEAAWAQPHLQALARHAQHIGLVSETLMQGISGLESPASLGFVLAAPAPQALRPHVGTVVLDRVQDPGNVGTLLRSAAAFGFAQVAALKGSVALWSPKVLRAAVGAHFSLHLCEALDPADLANLQVPWLASSPHALQALHEVALPWPCAWVLGHEGQGVDEALMAQCAQRLRIAQPGGQESLNVAVAAAVCFYESARQRLVSASS